MPLLGVKGAHHLIPPRVERSPSLNHSSRAAVVDHLHLMAHVNSFLNFCGTPENVVFANQTKKKKRYNVDSLTPAGCCHVSLFDNLREKRSVSLTKWSGVACFRKSYGTPFENHCSIVNGWKQFPGTPLPKVFAFK